MTLKLAQVEWQHAAKAAHDAKPPQADQPDSDKTVAQIGN